MAKVKFDNLDIISDGEEGDILLDTLQIGIPAVKREFLEMARGDGELVKFYNKPGVSHSFSVEFSNLTNTTLSTILTRLRTLATNKNMANLEIDYIGQTFNNCFVESVGQPQIELCWMPDSNYATTFQMAKRYFLRIDLSFKQVK